MNFNVSFGNRVLPKAIMLFNLPTRLTCPNHDLCNKSCYAISPENIYPQVLPSRMKNWEFSQTDRFADEMARFIDLYGVVLSRPHESGDYYSAEYADKWDYVIKHNPNTQFFAYTKSPYRPKKHKNFNLVESLLPDGSLNYGTQEYVTGKLIQFKDYGAVQCPYQSQKVCGVKCKICMSKKYVLFTIHGRGRKNGSISQDGNCSNAGKWRVYASRGKRCA